MKLWVWYGCGLRWSIYLVCLARFLFVGLWVFCAGFDFGLFLVCSLCGKYTLCLFAWVVLL